MNLKKTHVLAALGLIAAIVISAGWYFRETVQAKIYVSKLMSAPVEGVARWAEQAESWGRQVRPELMRLWHRPDRESCQRASFALCAMFPTWQNQPQEVARCLSDFSEQFAQLSTAGQEELFSCLGLLLREYPQETRPTAQTLARLGLQQSDVGVRVQAATLAMRPELGLAENLLPLLRDPAPEVRRVAILVVGQSRQLMSDDELLRWLHDGDPEVRKLCETALRSRGLRARDVQFGRLLTDPRPSERLRLLEILKDDSEIDLSAWLRRLCEDPSPSVRAAAVRVVAEQQVFQLTDRLAQMAAGDPDLTVRPIAAYHYQQMQPIRPVSAPAP